MRIALFINDLIGVENRKRFGRGKILSKYNFIKIIGGPIDSKINGAAVWYDALVQDTERLTMAVLMNAADNGACIANYVKATQLSLENNKVIGVCAEDRYGEDKFEIRSQKVVNATGPWIENLLDTLPNYQKKESRLVRGLNIVVKNCLFHDYAVGLEGSKATSYTGADFLMSKKRFFFFVPWNGKTMIGTNYKLYHGHPDHFRVERQDIEEFICEINQLYPPAGLEFKDVVFFHAGLLPLTEKSIEADFDLQPSKREALIDHEKRDGIKGLLSILSIKYTTAPIMAQKVIKKLGVSRKNKNTVERTKAIPADSEYVHFPGGLIYGKANMPSFDKSISLKYGPYADKIVSLISDNPNLASRISEEPPLIAAEIIYAIREEMALRLSDIISRRTGFGSAGCPSKQRLETVADIAARELGWSLRQKSDELTDALRCYRPLTTCEKLHVRTHTEKYAGITSR
jgi:glycerol-3-phosphate dehydrogenase